MILVGAIAGAGAAGVYGAASRFVTAGLIVSTAMRMVISPRFSALLSENKIEVVQKLYSVTVTWIVLLGAPIYGIFMFFAPTILGWLGEDFQRGSTALIILCLGAISSLMAGNVDSVLTMSGRSGWMLACSMFVDATIASIEVRIFIGIRFDVRAVAYALFVAAVSVVPASVGALLLMGNSTKACLAAGIATLLVLGLWYWADRRRLSLDDLALLRRKDRVTPVQPMERGR